ncbi:MAG: DNA polymerase subunit beta [Methanomicrobiales archaeon]|nr:DNA polymerase subunit beta [Methanomicrobiales archaeon]
MGRPVRLRDFVEDHDGWLYSVATYDNDPLIGCLLRYVPDPTGERLRTDGTRYRKLSFEEAYRLVEEKKPAYSGLVQRVPLEDLRRILKPEEEVGAVCARNPRVARLISRFDLPAGSYGCTGSLLCGLEHAGSDIDLVMYGDAWFEARRQLREAIRRGELQEIDFGMWRTIYEKRRPAIPFQVFLFHERRKWNRGQFEGTYFDLLYTRAYEELPSPPVKKGRSLGRMRLEAVVRDAGHAMDSPAVYEVEHRDVHRVLSFTHTYAEQAREGEVIQACGVCEELNGERWLVVGTTRDAPGEYIVSKTLLEEAGIHYDPGEWVPEIE